MNLHTEKKDSVTKRKVKIVRKAISKNKSHKLPAIPVNDTPFIIIEDDAIDDISCDSFPSIIFESN